VPVWYCILHGTHISGVSWEFTRQGRLVLNLLITRSRTAVKVWYVTIYFFYYLFEYLLTWLPHWKCIWLVTCVQVSLLLMHVGSIATPFFMLIFKLEFRSFDLYKFRTSSRTVCGRVTGSPHFCLPVDYGIFIGSSLLLKFFHRFLGLDDPFDN